MSLETEALVDRRRLRRKLTFWRGAVILLVVVAIATGLALAAGLGGQNKRSDHIARIDIEGVILDNRNQQKLIRKISKAEAVKGVILAINSPGGSTTGGEALYSALRELAEKKPVVAEIRTIGTSAGYMIALSADHIVARHNSITGSIGVLFQFGNIAELLNTVGVKMEAVKSAPLKAEPDFYSEPPAEARAMLHDLVMESYDWFVDLVAERRDLTKEEALSRSDGKVFSGFRAKALRLVDALGGEEVAIGWLEKEHSVEKDLPVITWKPADEDSAFPLTDSFSRSLGEGLASGLAGKLNIAKGLIPRGLALDGLVSVWQAPGAAQESNNIRGGGQ